MVIHGTSNAPPADGLPTWYQMPAPNEQNFCSKVAKLLETTGPSLGGNGRALPCDLPADIPSPSTGTGPTPTKDEWTPPPRSVTSHRVTKSEVAGHKSQVTSRKVTICKVTSHRPRPSGITDCSS